MFQAMSGIIAKLMLAHRGKIVQQEMIEIICDDSTGCEEAGKNGDYHRSRHRQSFNTSATSMRISFDLLQ